VKEIMLDKFIVHLKNIIFFKVVVYILITAILGMLIPIFQENLNKLVIKKQKAVTFVKEAALKLESIEGFEDRISAINDRYNSLVNASYDCGCIERTKFIHQINLLNEKYDLFTPIKVKIFSDFEGDTSITSNGYLKINYNVVFIQFRVPDISQLLLLSADLYQLIPYGSVVLSQNIKSIDVLTPDIIENLNTNKTPDAIEVKIRILLRNIIYEK
jgi:hypothetical protein